MSSRRVRSISTKVTEDEYALLAARAGAQTISEWSRTILLKAAAPDPPITALLGEVLALRHPAQPALRREHRHDADCRDVAVVDRPSRSRQVASCR